jgi:hypothetical protein
MINTQQENEYRVRINCVMDYAQQHPSAKVYRASRYELTYCFV